MKLDLEMLRQMHPLLPASTAIEYAHRAAVGLDRHSHKPGVVMEADLDGEPERAHLHWIPSPTNDLAQIDRHRVTEDAAEAIALALVHEARGWVVRRRLQRGESADWLLVDRKRSHVALEVSGIDGTDNGRRLREKKEQARQTTAAPCKAACVVELAAPRATLATL